MVWASIVFGTPGPPGNTPKSDLREVPFWTPLSGGRHDVAHVFAKEVPWALDRGLYLLRRHCGSKPELPSFDHRWFSGPRLQNDRPQNGPQKSDPKRTPKSTVLGPQKRKRDPKSPSAPGSGDLIPSRDAVRTGQPPGKPMRCGHICAGVGALRFHGPSPHPPRNTTQNPQEPPGAQFWAPTGFGPKRARPKPSAHTTPKPPDLVFDDPAAWQRPMSAIEGLGPNLDGAVVDLVSSLAKSGAKKGRFGTPQRARILACWRLAAGICMRTAPAKLVVATTWRVLGTP